MATRFYTVCLIAVLAAAGCVATAAPQPELFAWKHYEPLLYEASFDQGSSVLRAQIVRLRQELDAIEADGGRVAPGVHAHLGYAYFLLGDPDAALQHFDAEARLFPESIVFMQTLSERLRVAMGHL